MSSLIDSVRDIVHTCRPEIRQYEALYKTLHSNPELSHQEKETAALIKHHLTTLTSDLDIRGSIGGHGLIGILKNGPGPTVLLRADMDALPVEEKTGLEYASRKQATDIDGKLQSVGHGQYAINPQGSFDLILPKLTKDPLLNSMWTRCARGISAHSSRNASQGPTIVGRHHSVPVPARRRGRRRSPRYGK